MGSCYNHKTSPEICKTQEKQWKPNIFLFPLIPNRATTTKLAQKLETHPKPMKTMFSHWVSEKATFWRYYAGSSWSYLIIFKIVPQLCTVGNLFRPLARSWSQLLTFRYKKLCRYHFVKNYSNISYISLSCWNNIFLMSNHAGRILYYSEVCWRGYTLKAPLMKYVQMCNVYIYIYK